MPDKLSPHHVGAEALQKISFETNVEESVVLGSMCIWYIHRHWVRLSKYINDWDNNIAYSFQFAKHSFNIPGTRDSQRWYSFRVGSYQLALPQKEPSIMRFEPDLVIYRY